MSYIDGFVIAVPTANKEQFIERARKDGRMDPEKNPAPFDGSRLIYGGFMPIVESK